MLTIRSVRRALEDVLKIVDGRPYRLEGDAAAYVLGRGTPIDNLIATFEGDSDNLDELATSCASRLQTVQTVRGGLYTPQIRFEIDGGTAVLRVVAKARPSIEVAFEGLMVHVPPLDELGLDAAA